MGGVVSSFSQLGTTIVAGTVGAVVYKVANSLMTAGKKFFYNVICSKVQVSTKDNPKLVYAIKRAVENSVSKNRLNVMIDGTTEPNFTLGYNTYRIKTQKCGYIWVIYNENIVTLYALPNIGIRPLRCQSKIEKLKQYITKVYKTYCRPSKMIMKFISNTDKWSFPIVCSPTNFKMSNATPEMKLALDDIEKFKSNSTVYSSLGVPYRRGYLLYGTTGAGKTTVIELAAKSHNMSIYNLTLNSDNMNDTTLLNLFSNVPANSIIAIEEIDKQLKSLQNNKRANVTIGGLLSGIDGPQRLSHGSIVIMTANTNNFVDTEIQKCLFRRGRIDRQIEFTTRINIEFNIFG